MKWAKALLHGMHNTDNADGVFAFPLKHVFIIVAHRNPITNSSVNENTYALGFARAMIPSTELGMLSLNGLQREHIMGKDSASQLVLYHNGGQLGY